MSILTVGTLASSCNDIVETLQLKNNHKKTKRVTNSKEANTFVEDNGIELQVLSETQLKQAALRKSILSITNSETMKVLKSLPQGKAAESINKNSKDIGLQEESLLVGFPIGLIGEQNVFGGVITKVTDKDNQMLGSLKLTDLSPIHVRTVISKMPGGKPAMSLVGCFENCSEDSELVPLVNLPIVGFNQDAGMLILDLSTLGKELDLISMLDPTGQYTKLKAISADTVSVEFDLKTLIFDVKTRMIPVSAGEAESCLETTDFTVRWYLKLGSSFNPAFKSREATEGVGFFKTERSSNSKITRFSTSNSGISPTPVKYFIKNIPDEFKTSFVRAIESWNKEFKQIIGKELISYEFIEPTDPRSELLVPGDIRYNIIEWDLVNKASYGGLGPSIANQYSGETISANILIQGPTIVKIYTEWFGISQKAEELRSLGKLAQANQLIKNFENSISNEIISREKQTFRLKLGKHLNMNIHAQRPELEDPIKKGHFEIIPAGMTYEKYMEGYMIEILAHEIGHNLGLRHNFKGNLGAYENNNDPGSVSRSIMEYLGRPFRYLNTIGPYDRMAIAYGYKGKNPNHLNWFCTDEDQGHDAKSLAKKSPECSKSDATSDPFSFWEGRLSRIIDLVVETKSDIAPVWKVEDVKTQINEVVTGLSAYALSAEATAETWTNFFGKNDRPEVKSDVKAYVLQKIKKKLCNPELKDIINAKESIEAQKIALDNLELLKKLVSEKTTNLGLYTAQDLGCNE